MEFEDTILGYEINEDFKVALDAVINQKRNVFISGSGGVGKSTFLEVLDHLIDKKEVSIAKVAPTGIAAVRIGGSTIHSFFQFPIGPLHLGRGMSGLEKKEEAKEVANNVRILVIDEISMVRADIFENINFVFQNMRDPNKPFGGVQIILLGDLFQLSPIVKDKDDQEFLDIEFGGKYFFETFSYAEGNFQCIEFKKVYRQKDQKFKDHLNILRSGEVTKETLEYFNNAIIDEMDFARKTGGGYVHLVSTNKAKDAINEGFLQLIEGELKEFPAVISGKFREQDSLMEMNLRLKKGCQVMAVKNNKGMFYNGSVGEVIDFPKIWDAEQEKERQLILVDFTDTGQQYIPLMADKNISYKYNKKKRIIEEEDLGSIQQFPLVLAFSRTIHKSQSATFDKVYLDVGSYVFANGLVYTALSRCKSYENLGLARPIKGRDCTVDEKVKDFYKENFG